AQIGAPFRQQRYVRVEPSQKFECMDIQTPVLIWRVLQSVMWLEPDCETEIREQATPVHLRRLEDPNDKIVLAKDLGPHVEQSAVIEPEVSIVEFELIGGSRL